METVTISEGLGEFVFPDKAAGPRQSMRVFYYRPKAARQDAHILIALHGLDRAASAFRDVLISPAERHGIVVIVPEFDADAFPDVYAYNYGNVIGPPPGKATLPKETWSFGIIDRIFQCARRSLRTDRQTFGLFGNSAGSQFVLRYLALTEAAHVDAAVASSSGVYMLPDLSVGYPDGMGGVALGESSLARYFLRPLTIVLGEADSDAGAFDLPRTAEAMAQGPHRLARGLWHFDHCRKIANRLGLPFAWRLTTVPGAGHIHPSIFDTAIDTIAR